MMFTLVQTQEQIEKVAQLAQKIWTEHYAKILSEEQIAYMLEQFQSKKAVKAQIRSDYRYYLIPCQGQDVGYFSIVVEDGKMFLSKIYIEKAFRKKGLATAAIRFIEGLCREEGCKCIWLTVNKQNDSVHAYERLGFRTTRSQVTDIGNGFVMDDYIMEKEL